VALNERKRSTKQIVGSPNPHSSNKYSSFW